MIRSGCMLSTSRRVISSRTWSPLMPFSARLARQRRLHVGGEQRMALARIGGELRMELAADEPRMHLTRQFHHLAQVGDRRTAGDHQTLLFELREQGVVHFVAVT